MSFLSYSVIELILTFTVNRTVILGAVIWYKSLYSVISH